MLLSPPLRLLPLPLLRLLSLLLLLRLSAVAGQQGAVAVWRELAPMPLALAEVSAGMLQDAGGHPLLAVVGRRTPGDVAANTATLLLNLSTNTWARRADRPHPGDHMAGYVADNRLYLVGGFAGGAQGAMQVYDPLADRWALGPPPPFASGAAAGARLGRQLYYCGGVRDGNTTHGPPISDCARFNLDTGSWERISPLPYAVHHAAAGSDGRRLFVFGGRQSAGNSALQPVSYTQVYDPGAEAWSTTAAPLPEARGGMGPAVWLGGRLLVLSGEVKCSLELPCPDPSRGRTDTGVYTRIDSYDPSTDRWELLQPGMALPRHGIHPLAAPPPPDPAPKPASQATAAAKLASTPSSDSSGSGPPDDGDAVVYVCGGATRGGFGPTTACQYMSLSSGPQQPLSPQPGVGNAPATPPPPTSTPAQVKANALPPPPSSSVRQPLGDTSGAGSAGASAAPPSASSIPKGSEQPDAAGSCPSCRAHMILLYVTVLFAVQLLVVMAV